MIRKLPLIAVLASALVLAVAQLAFAQSSSVDTYAGGGGKVQAQIASGAPGGDNGATAEPPGSGALPFTGLDLGLAAGGGLLLLIAGATMAAVASRQTREEH